MSEKLNLTLKVWRQEDGNQSGDFVTYPVDDVNPHMSFLELLDVLNEKLISEGGDPIAFEHDCRERERERGYLWELCYEHKWRSAWPC